MIRQWTLSAVVHQRLPNSSLLHIAPVPVQYLHYQSIKAYQPKQSYIKPISTSSATQTKPQSQPQSCTASPPPLLAPPAPPTPASSPPYVHSPQNSALAAISPSIKSTPSNPIDPQTLRQSEQNNNTGGLAGAAVKGIEKAGEVAQKVKEATGLGTGQAQGKANEVSGTASGKANELAGQAQGKAAELEGKAKGAFEQAKGKTGQQ